MNIIEQHPAIIAIIFGMSPFIALSIISLIKELRNTSPNSGKSTQENQK